MNCDRNGQPDPNGNYQLIDGKLCVREGRTVGFELALMDGAPGAPATLSDAESTLVAARARQLHDTRYAYLPASQRPAFTSEMARAAVRDAATLKEQQQAAQRSLAAEPGNSPSYLAGVRLAQQVTRKHLISDAWKR